MLCQNPNRLFPLFCKQDIQNQLNSLSAWLPSLLLWNGNKCYLGKKKGFQFSHTSILGMKKFQTPALDQAGTLCLATELSASRAASLCFDPLIRLLAAMAKGPDWRAAQECHWQGGCALPGLMDRVLKVPWHSTHPDSFPGCSHHCLLHSALQQGSPGLPGSVYTSLWTQAPSVYPHCQK